MIVVVVAMVMIDGGVDGDGEDDYSGCDGCDGCDGGDEDDNGN